MKFFSTKITFLLLLTILTGPGSLEAARYKHRATRLGNPATRFAPTIHTIEDLRSRFRDPKLRPDIASICRQAGWTGDLEDLHHAALNFEIVPLEIPKGTIMPFMSSRKNGRPIALMDVLWAGEKPIQALAFDFISKGIRYKCITPKPCSNFFIEYVGPVISRLSLKCNSPERQFTDRPVKVCLTVSNTGEVTESPRVVLNLPNNAEPQTATDNGTYENGTIVWKLGELDPGRGKEVCATFTSARPGDLKFPGKVTGNRGGKAECGTTTKILGVYGLLIEVVDVEDPIRDGNMINYVVTVTNQGDLPLSNVKVDVNLPRSQSFASGEGDTSVTAATGTGLRIAPIRELRGKAKATWRVRTTARRTTNTEPPQDSRLSIEVSCDQIRNPIREEESTMIY